MIYAVSSIFSNLGYDDIYNFHSKELNTELKRLGLRDEMSKDKATLVAALLTYDRHHQEWIVENETLMLAKAITLEFDYQEVSLEPR